MINDTCKKHYTTMTIRICIRVTFCTSFKCQTKKEYDDYLKLSVEQVSMCVFSQQSSGHSIIIYPQLI